MSGPEHPIAVLPPGIERGMRLLGPGGMPAEAEPLLSPPERDLCSSRLWYDTTLRHALPPGGTGWLAAVGPPGALAVPLLDLDGHLESLTTHYSLSWRPLAASWAGPEAVEAGAAELGELLRHRPPVLLKAMDPLDPRLAPFCAGLQRARLAVRRFDHFGNWHEALSAGLSWEDYAEARPQPLRSTLRRKRRAWAAETCFELIRAPGRALEEAVAAYEAVRARSWKPAEPAPAFDPALMRSAAAAGILRLGVLRTRGEGRPLAAQYWILSGGRATLLKLVHDEAARDLSPGTGLTARMIAALIEEGVGGIDFGRGDDAYKRLWARERRQRIGLLVADPLNAAGMLALARHAAGRGRRRLLGLFGRHAARERAR